MSSSVVYDGHLSGSYGLIIDSEGNVAISRTANAGGGTPSVGSSISQTIVGNIDYSNYGGWGGNIGGSVNVGPTIIAAGGDVVIMGEGENEKHGHMGLSGNIGWSVLISGVPLEVHGEANYTRILGHVNIYTGEFEIGKDRGYEGNIYDGIISEKKSNNN